MTENEVQVLNKKIDDISKALIGDNDIDGSKGIVGEIREIKKILTDYPPLKLSASKAPFKFTLTGLISFVTFWMIMYLFVNIPTVDIWLCNLLHLPMP